jgi:hypothetical protein
MHVRKADTGASEGKPDLLDAFENSFEDSIYEAARPVPHEFALSLVAGESVGGAPQTH